MNPTGGPALTPTPNPRTYTMVFLGVATLVMGVLCLQVLGPFLAAIAWAIVLAVAVQAPWAFLRRKLPRKPNLSAGLLTVGVGLLIIIPAGILIGVVAGQVVEAAGKISARLGSAHITSFSDVVQLPAVVRVLDRLREHAGMTPEDLQQWAHDLAGRISLIGPALSARLAFSVFDGLLTFFMTLLLLFFFIRDGAAMSAAALDLVPVSPVLRGELSQSLGRMLQAIFRGTLALALVQGVLGGIGWAIAGLPLPALAGAAMAVASLLPVGGTAIVWLPGCIWAWSMGHHGMAIFLGLWGALVTSLLADSVLRPMLIRGAEELSTLVVILGVFGGLAAFGLLGVFLGPVILALAVTLLRALRIQAQDGLPLDEPHD
jgi:predicted PurR-regulated permease PerM